MNIFQGDLTNISAKTKPLIMMCANQDQRGACEGVRLPVLWLRLIFFPLRDVMYPALLSKVLFPNTFTSERDGDSSVVHSFPPELVLLWRFGARPCPSVIFFSTVSKSVLFNLYFLFGMYLLLSVFIFWYHFCRNRSIANAGQCFLFSTFKNIIFGYFDPKNTKNF